jgi:hypothetical protein
LRLGPLLLLAVHLEVHPLVEERKVSPYLCTPTGILPLRPSIASSGPAPRYFARTNKGDVIVTIKKGKVDVAVTKPEGAF